MTALTGGRTPKLASFMREADMSDRHNTYRAVALGRLRCARPDLSRAAGTGVRPQPLAMEVFVP